ncbi:hypothetical protein [Pseudoalteromonas sp.]|uniref:hypothetical protein n=1 Tax=Pseudoalteromonas sp. TaxID=53249 RepID=UPI003001AED3
MSKFLIVFLLISFNAFGDVISFGCGEIFVFGRGNQNIYLSNDDFLNSSDWKLGDVEPPVSLNIATEKVVSHIENNYPKEDINFAFIHLKHESCIIDGEMKTIWLYIFGLDSPDVLVGVTMVGRLIESKTKTE